jgi:hypothetical protein
MKIINWEQNVFKQQRIVSAVQRVQLVSDRMSYIALRGCWCNIFVLNPHAPTEDASDDSKAVCVRHCGRCSIALQVFGYS